MEAFSIELLNARGWRRMPSIYWTIDDAKAAGSRLLRRRVAKQIRVLPVNIALQPIAFLPEQPEIITQR